MQRLTGLDEMFLSVDAAGTTSGVMGGLVVYRTPLDAHAGRVPAMVQRIQERLDYLPPFSWRLSKAPLGLDHASWQQVDVDVAEHVHSVTLPSPGTRRQLADEVARIMTHSLDLKKPLWELYVIEGLEDGQIAHLLRVHHGMIDGSSLPTVLDMLSDSPMTPLEQSSATLPSKEWLTGWLGRLARAAAANLTKPAKAAKLQMQSTEWLAGRIKDDGVLAGPAFLARMLPGGLGRPLRKVVNLRQKATGQPEVKPLLPTLRKPHTPFNRTVTANRTFAFSDLPLGDFKRVGKTLGYTLNDVVVAVVAGSLRRYLEARGGVPDRPLTVCIPASLRTGDEDPYWGNYISMFFAELPTHVDDPIERLRLTHDNLLGARKSFQALPIHLIRPVSEFIPMAVWSVPQKVLSKAPDWLPTSQWNVVVSNVRGPSEPMTVAGAEMVGYWPAAFLTMGMGLNITLQSYVDRLDFGFMGASDLTGDLWELPAFMQQELQTLLELTGSREGGHPAGRSIRSAATTNAAAQQAPPTPPSAKTSAPNTDLPESNSGKGARPSKTPRQPSSNRATTKRATTKGPSPTAGSAGQITRQSKTRNKPQRPST